MNGVVAIIYWLREYLTAKRKGASSQVAVQKALGIYDAPKGLVIIWITLILGIFGVLIFAAITGRL